MNTHKQEKEVKICHKYDIPYTPIQSILQLDLLKQCVLLPAVGCPAHQQYSSLVCQRLPVLMEPIGAQTESLLLSKEATKTYSRQS